MHLPAILPWGAAEGFSKQMLLVILSVVIIATFFVLAARKQQLVPGKLQFAGEAAYGFVRNGIAKDIIGGKDFIKYVPLLFSLFFFILVNNIYGAIPVIQLPSFSHVGGAYVLAGIVYFTWIAIGVKKNGLRYFKLATVPSRCSVATSCRSSSRSRSSPTSWSARSRTASVCSPPCWPAT